MKTKRNLWFIPWVIMGFVLLFTNGCESGDEEEQEQAEVPTLTTTAATAITQTTVTCGGTVTDDGGAEVIQRGVVFSSTYTTPTTSDGLCVATVATGTGAFTSNISALLPNTTYYARAYAMNSVGTGYGGVVTFTTLEEGTVADVDGNVYHSVTVGTLVWSLENLKVTHYRNSDPIPNVTDNATWSALTSGAYCDYENDPDNSPVYGRLYNWYAVTDSRNIAPEGWHVATASEWMTLINYLIDNGYGYGGSGDDIAKSLASISGWTAIGLPGCVGNDQTSNNSSGFTGLPSGYRLADGSYIGLESRTFWWGAETGARPMKGIFYNDDDVQHQDLGDQSFGASVRCVKDY